MAAFRVLAVTSRRVEAGFSLLELVVVMAVLGVIFGIAVPAFSDFVGGQRVRGASFDLFSSLILARNEGINRNVNTAARIVVEPVAGSVCTVAPNSCNWAKGWTLKHNGVDVHVQESLPADITIDGPRKLEFDRTGRAAITGITSFDIRSQGSTSRRCLTLDTIGRATSKVGACS